MCLVHLSDNLRDNEGAILPERLELLCSSCRVYGQTDAQRSAGYAGLRLNFLDDDEGICTANKQKCLEALCNDCIEPGPPVVYSPNPRLAGTCAAAAPMCDRYMYNYTQQICMPRYDACPPGSIGNSQCDAGCDTQACGYDQGDCCAIHVPTTSDTIVGNGACNDDCNTEFCLFDDGDCDFCSLNVTGAPDCYPQWIGDGECHRECYIGECSFDGGDCGECPAACVATLGNGVCNEECYDLCPKEAEDCDHCSARAEGSQTGGCPLFQVGDGTCNRVKMRLHVSSAFASVPYRCRHLTCADMCRTVTMWNVLGTRWGRRPTATSADRPASP